MDMVIMAVIFFGMVAVVVLPFLYFTPISKNYNSVPLSVYIRYRMDVNVGRIYKARIMNIISIGVILTILFLIFFGWLNQDERMYSTEPVKQEREVFWYE
ncbi:MAG: hypothetical protein KAJ19_03690 [Gammaproteobacteria bacterium]|nr:hypothetical protein [Gammaproteobacteria bacterium]